MTALAKPLMRRPYNKDLFVRIMRKARSWAKPVDIFPLQNGNYRVSFHQKSYFVRFGQKVRGTSTITQLLLPLGEDVLTRNLLSSMRWNSGFNSTKFLRISKGSLLEGLVSSRKWIIVKWSILG